MSYLSSFYLGIFTMSLLLFGSSGSKAQIFLSLLLGIGMLRGLSVKLGKAFNLIIWSILIWGLILLIPIPLNEHLDIYPFAAETRNRILEELQIQSYPLALNPRVHLQGLIWLLTNCLLMIFIRTNSTKNDLQKINKGLIIIVTSFCILGWIQFLSKADFIFWKSSIPTFSRDPFFGTMINPNHASYYLGAMLPLIYPLWKNHWAKTIILFFASTIIFLGSRGAIIATIFGFLVWFYLQQRSGKHEQILQSNNPKRFTTKRPLLLGFALLIGISAFFAFGNDLSWDEVTTMRTYIWSDALKLYEDIPFQGLGIGGFIVAYPFVKSHPLHSITSHAHQEYLETLLDFGPLLSGLLLLGVLGTLVAVLYKNPAQSNMQRSAISSIMVLVVASFVDFPFRIGAISLLFSYLFSTLLPSFIQQRRRSILSLQVIQASLLALVLFSLVKPTNYTPAFAKDYLEDFRPLQTNPLSEFELQNYLYSNPNAALIQNLVDERPNNIYSWLLLARYEHSQKNYSNACHAWEQLWTLEFQYANRKMDYIPEALACSTNTWMSIISLPEDSKYLVKAGLVLEKQNLIDLADFTFSRAKNLDNNGLDQYLGFLNRQKRWKKSWIKLKNRPASNCIQAKNKASFAWNFNFKETEYYLKQSIEYCGSTDFRERRLFLWRLRRGDPDAIEEVIHKPEYYDYILQSLLQEEKHFEACQYVRQQMLTNNDNKNIYRDLKDCKTQKYPQRFPLWNIISEKEFKSP